MSSFCLAMVPAQQLYNTKLQLMEKYKYLLNVDEKSHTVRRFSHLHHLVWLNCASSLWFVLAGVSATVKLHLHPKRGPCKVSDELICGDRHDLISIRPSCWKNCELLDWTSCSAAVRCLLAFPPVFVYFRELCWIFPKCYFETKVPKLVWLDGNVFTWLVLIVSKTHQLIWAKEDSDVNRYWNSWKILCFAFGPDHMKQVASVKASLERHKLTLLLIMFCFSDFLLGVVLNGLQSLTNIH